MKMGDRRRMLLIAGSIAALAVAALLLSRARDDYGLPRRFAFVCVATGEKFELSIEEAKMIPARNPKTGQLTLVFCTRDADGVYRIEEGDRALVEGELKGVNKFVDPITLEVRPR